MDPVRRAVVVRHRLSLLRALHRLPRARGRRHPGHARGATAERQGLRRHRPPGALRPPLRRDRRRRAARRTGPGGADGLPARHDLDHRRRHLRRCRPGHGGAVLLDAPRRQEPGPDGARGDRRGRRHRRPDRGLRDHDHHPRGPGPGRGQRAGRVPVGRLLDRADHPDRAVHGLLPAAPPAGPGGRGDRDRRRAAAARDHRRRVRRADGPRERADPLPGAAHPRARGLRVRRLDPAGVDAAHARATTCRRS